MEENKNGINRTENENAESTEKRSASKFHFANVKIIPGPKIDDPVSSFYAGNEQQDNGENAAKVEAVKSEPATTAEELIEENETAAELEAVIDTESETEYESVPEAEAVVEVETEAEPIKGNEAVAELEAVVDAEPAEEYESVSEAEAVIEAEPAAEVSFDNETDIYSNSKTDTESEPVPEEKNVFDVSETEVESAVISEPVIKESEPAEDGNDTPTICIIDETSTSVTIEEGPDIAVDEILPSNGKKAKKQKEPLKLKPIQIILMAVVGLVALWFVIFTVDHTLAANGISPVFCKKEVEYDDGSVSYKGLDHKVQFKFDAQGNLTQMVLPAWKDGPNDVSE